MDYTFLDCKQNVDVVVATLMSISDGLGPYIFCRKMEKAGHMREEMEGKVVFSRQSRQFLTWMLYSKKYFSLFVP